MAIPAGLTASAALQARQVFLCINVDGCVLETNRLHEKTFVVKQCLCPVVGGHRGEIAKTIHREQRRCPHSIRIRRCHDFAVVAGPAVNQCGNMGRCNQWLIGQQDDDGSRDMPYRTNCQRYRRANSLFVLVVDDQESGRRIACSEDCIPVVSRDEDIARTAAFYGDLGRTSDQRDAVQLSQLFA